MTEEQLNEEIKRIQLDYPHVFNPKEVKNVKRKK